MNYRHAFHAGSFTDVVKHLIVTRILVYLKRKETAFRVLDTHAGIGLYDLHGAEAQRSPEWRAGIVRLLEAELPPAAASLAAPYIECIRALNPDGGLRHYPGSPLLARRLMRPQDRLFALELHPVDAARLKTLFAGDVQVRVTELDGWAALGTHLPPKERRGLVLVDPPFEQPDEFARVADGLTRAHKRFPNGIYALWYPLKDVRAVNGFVADLKASGIAPMLRAELTIGPPRSPPALFGTGMIIVNPPFALEGELSQLLPALARVLATPGSGRHRLDWLAGEG